MNSSYRMAVRGESDHQQTANVIAEMDSDNRDKVTSPPSGIEGREIRGSGQGSASNASPNDGETQGKENVVQRCSWMTKQSLVSWSFVALLTVQISILSFLTVAWFSLFHTAQAGMARTFAWELVVTLLGAYYNDCILQPGRNSPSVQAMHPIGNPCLVGFTLPWIPLVGGITCLLTVFAVSWAIARVVYFRKHSSFWTKLLSVICSLDTMILIVTIINFSSASISKRDMKGHMEFTMKEMNADQLPSEIYFRWNVSQLALKCCGMFGPGDWRFPIFRKGDPRFPTSCCNAGADNLRFKCSQRRYPNRYHVWQVGCYVREMSIVASYENWIILLLVLSVASVIILAMITALLAVSTRESPCPSQLLPRMREIKVTLLRKSITCRFDNHHYDRRRQQESLPVELTHFKEIPLGTSEFEDSKSDNTRSPKETDV